MFCVSRKDIIYEDWRQLKKENVDLRNQLMQHSGQMIAIQSELHTLRTREQTLAQQNELLHVENQQALQAITNQLSGSKKHSRSSRHHHRRARRSHRSTRNKRHDDSSSSSDNTSSNDNSSSDDNSTE